MTAGRRERRGIALVAFASVCAAIVLVLSIAQGGSPEPAAITAPESARSVAAIARGDVATKASSAPTRTAAGAAAAAMSIGGFVRDSLGNGVGGAEVRLERLDGGGAIAVASGDDGGWSAPTDGSPCRVRAHADDYGTSVAVFVEPKAWQPSDPIELFLLRPVLVRGMVIDGLGRPLAGAWIYGASRPSIADAAGRFEFEIAPQPALMLSAMFDQQIVVPATLLPLHEGVDILLAPPGTFVLRGRVTDERGQTFPGDVETRLVAVPLLRGPDEFVRGMPSWSDVADRDGSFAFTVASHEILVAAIRGDRASQWVACRFDHTNTQPFVEIRLRPNLATRGVVVDAAGAPLAGVEVTATPDDRAGLIERILRTTGADGGFEFLLPQDSRFRLRVSGGESVEVDAGRQDLRIRCGLDVGGKGWELRPAGVDGVKWVRFLPDRVVREQTLVHRLPSPLPLPDPSELSIAEQVNREIYETGPMRLAEMRPAPWLLEVDGRFALLPEHDRASLVFVDVNPSAAVDVVVQVLRHGAPMRGVCVEVQTGSEDHKEPVGIDGIARFERIGPPGPAVVHVWRGRERLVSRLVELVAGTPLTIEVP